MIKKLFAVPAVLCLLASVSWAQGGKALRSFSKAVRRPVVYVPVQAARTSFAVPARLYKIYRADLHNLYFENIIPAVKYPKLSRQNNQLLEQGLKYFEYNEEVFSSHASEIANLIKSEVYPRRVPYAQLLPQKLDVLYIGEIHGQPRVRAEVKDLLKSLKTVYPGRRIYLAAERIPSDGNIVVSEENLIRDEAALAEALEIEENELDLLVDPVDVLQTALREEIPLLGLEDIDLLLRLSTPEGKAFPTDEEFESFAESAVGMRVRNEAFARRLRALRRFDPEALVVVYGGIDHMAYHNKFSVPSLVQGKSFVVQMLTPFALRGTNPLFLNFRETEEIRRGFASSPDAKLVESWTEPTSFNQILGNDLTVIVHE